jgi:hypothetical protein
LIIPSEIAAGFYYISSLSSPALEQEMEAVKSKLYMFPESYRQWFEWCVDYYANYDQPPPWDRIKEQWQMENEITLSPSEARDIFHSQMAVWESDALASKLTSVPLTQRRDLLLRLSSVLSADTQEETELSSTSTFSVDGTIIRSDVKQERYCSLFTQHLNDICIVNPGTTVSIIGSPGTGKSQAALNIVYLNSVVGHLNSLYIYLENTEQAYNIELLSRHSYANGMLVENSTLKRGVDASEPRAADIVRELQRSLQSEKKGEIYFASFSRFNPEPLRFANQLSKMVKDHNINLVVFDYLQRAKSYTPLRWDRREYINQVMSDFCTCALGSFGCDPFVAVALAQPKREAEERMLKTKGVGMTLYDAAEVSSIERDSFISIGVYSDAELKSNQSMIYKVLKNRDNSVDVSTVTVAAIPQYCFIGDLGNDSQNSISYSKEDAMELLNL